MIPPSSAASQGARDDFDTGPLSWVMGEVREALNRSRSAIQEAVAQDADARATSMHHAKSYLHQAHGALQIVDVDGAAAMTEATEELLNRVDAGQVALTPEIAQAVGDGYQALIEYLDELLSGMPHQPLRLFPYYRALLEARAAERIHPADLFFPNLAIRPRFPGAEAVGAVSPAAYAGLRQRYEKALLPFLKSTERNAELANAAAMRDVLAEIERMQHNQQARAFWWVMHGLAEAVAAGQLDSEVHVKQLFARINVQIRHLSQGAPSIPEGLLRDALFFIAKVSDPSPRAQQIRNAYQLDGLVPPDYDAKRYGQIDVDALAAAKERLSHAKNVWNRIAGGDAAAADAFEHEMRALAEAGSRLNSAALSRLLRELKGIARHAAHANPGDILSLEMATSLLFVEHALNNIGRLPASFDERAHALTARLLAVVSGEVPAHAAEWLDDMSREAQQRQTMVALAGEMQASLRQVEKMLDEYFRDPSQSAPLGQLDTVLHQIEGALAVLDQDDAMRTIQHTRSAVQRFIAAEADAVPDHEDFQQVAQNVGALSFFIETLQLPSEQAKKRFSFDQERGVFSAHLVGHDPAPEAAGPDAGPVAEIVQSADPSAGTASDALPTAEDELAFHQRQSAALAVSLAAEPDNQALQEQLKDSLAQVRRNAALVDDPDAKERASAGIDILARPDFAVSQDALAGIITATVPAAAADPLPPVVAPATDEAVDAELLEIFLSEAEEVLGTVRQTLPESRNHPHNKEHLTTLRRCFHTLKGSSRMVGLLAFGEAAWSIEQVMNVRLSESRSGDADLYALLDKAADILDVWVQDLKLDGHSGSTPHALAAAAERVKAGERFAFDPALAAAMPESAPLASGGASFGELSTLELALPLDPLPPVDVSVPAPADNEDEAAEDPFEEVPESSMGLPQAEELPLSDADLALFDAAQMPASCTDAEEGRRAGEPVQAPLVSIADVIEFPTLQPPEDRRDDTIKHIGDLEIGVPLYNIYVAETDDLVRMLAQDIAEWRHEPEREVNIKSVHAAHSLAGSSATVGFKALQEVAHALELVLQMLARTSVRLAPHEFDTVEQSVERLRFMLQQFALGEMPPHEPEHVRRLDRIRQDVEAHSEALDQAEEFPPAASDGAGAGTLGGMGEPGADVLPPAPASQDRLPEQAETAPAEPALASKDAPADASMGAMDELDADLLPVFLEEGRDMLPQLGLALRGWQESPADLSRPQSMLRLLHTLKGSARMAGAMTLGQHLHDMETRTENIMRLGQPSPLAIEDLLIRYDQGLAMFDQLQSPVAAAQLPVPEKAQAEPAPPPVPRDPDAALRPLMPQPDAALAAPVAHAAPVPAGPVPMVRVRADILDRLVNQAGEVSISRSRLENEVGTLKQSLSDLTENLARLRDQLREIEMQAETQIASHRALTTDRDFDPLEFDRFTRLQELTRMMAESVNDVGSVHQNLSRSLDSAADDLSAQARLTRDLQQDLMRVRMVQFGSISERLFRVTRQAAKEVDKRVNLDIRGATVEIDRSVLEKMAGPFEHLLRNAIVHGIEPREARRAAGKNETGELLIEIRQEGNEVVIQFADDGKGLDLARIRDKAVQQGLLASDSPLPDQEITNLIFQPGFSTADEITELAGRGVGMDVVRSEAAALGGRVSAWSEAGKGAYFTIRLPLTLAVTQVVLLATGGKTYAVPSVLVEQVQHLKTNALAAAYNDGAVVWQGQRTPLHYLSALLGDAASAPVTQQYSPLLILKSGNDRVAIHVDEIIGNREVVVKNTGPQLTRMIGIAGATVLGSGDIVLILNPVPLAQRATHERPGAPPRMGAVAEMAGQAPSVAASEPVQGLRTQSTVMVVDDSLTVRRVTQRLLSREGYQVVLAKDGVDALEHLQSVTPDVMLVDIEMPRMDGFDLTRNVRSDERTRHIPIIMITSRTASRHRNYAFELGVNEYLGKPYQEAQLLALVAAFLQKGGTGS